MRTWQQILNTSNSSESALGSNTGQIAAAVEALLAAPLLARVGEEDLNGTGLLADWEEAMRALKGPGRTIMGHPEAVCRANEALMSPEDRNDWERTIHYAHERYDWNWVVQERVPAEFRDDVFEYLWEFDSMLYVELIVADRTSVTYFREALALLVAGHLPCGQVDGRMIAF